jgi:hypothetical protein
MKTNGHDPAQEELALSSVLSHALFPGRTTLYVAEVAKALHTSEQQVLALIEEWQQTGTTGLRAINIANGPASAAFKAGNKSARGCYRIPVSGYDDFIRRASGGGQVTSNQ